VPQYEISDWHGHRDRTAAVSYRGADHFRPLLLPAHLILSYPGRSGEVQPCLQAKAKLTQLHVIEYCTSAEQEGSRVGPVQWARRVPQGGLRREAGREYEFTATNSQKQVPNHYEAEDLRDSHGKKGGRSGAVTNNRPETARTPAAPGKHSTASGHRVSPLTCYYGGPERVLPPST
jgi:hypothetical protein